VRHRAQEREYELHPIRAICIVVAVWAAFWGSIWLLH
jgi:hypothetical protein